MINVKLTICEMYLLFLQQCEVVILDKILIVLRNAGKHLLSVGFPHDGQICIFDYKTGMLVSKLKAITASSPIQEIQFASDGSFFVTAGSNHLSNWTIHSVRSKPSQGTGTHTLECRNINLGSLNENSFAAVASLEDVKETGETKEIQPIYAVTSAGMHALDIQL